MLFNKQLETIFNENVTVLSSSEISKHKSLSKIYSTKESEPVGRALYVDLRLEPHSDGAKRFAADLTVRIKTTKGRGGSELKDALGALIADLFQAIDTDADGYGYRLMTTGTFSGQRIGSKPFVKAQKGLQSLGLITVVKGWKSLAKGAPHGNATTFHPTADLLTEAACYGILPGNVWDHFGFPATAAAVKRPVVLKAASRKNFSLRTKTAGRSMKFDLTAKRATQAATFVNAYNLFVAKHELNVPHAGFVRIFNNGDQPGFDWDQGGRLYVSEGGFQKMPQRCIDGSKPDRSGLTINGSKTSEIDIGASHYTIAMSIAKLHFDTTSDPYIVAGFPRSIVKEYVNICLGNGKSVRCWPSAAKSAYNRPDQLNKPNRYSHNILAAGFHYTGDLEKDYPIRRMKSHVLPAFPVLSKLEKCGINWGRLQYIESSIVIDTLEELMNQDDVLALPVHDSLICRESEKEIAISALSYWFHQHTGITPRLTIK